MSWYRLASHHKLAAANSVGKPARLPHNAGMFKLTFLGTSSGVPTRYRNVTSLALQTTHNRDWWMLSLIHI